MNATQAGLPHVEGVTHRMVGIGGLELHVAEFGEGPPLLLLHGWPQHWYAWRKVAPRLAPDRRVICPDLRGFGWSDAPPGDYAKATLAQDVIRLLDALELDRVDLIAHDWGAWIGFMLCLEHPGRFEHFLALNMYTPWPDPPTPRAIMVMARLWYQVALATPGLGQGLIRQTPFVSRLITAGAVHPAWTEEELRAFTSVLQVPERANASVRLYRTFLLRELPALPAGAVRRSALDGTHAAPARNPRPRHRSPRARPVAVARRSDGGRAARGLWAFHRRGAARRGRLSRAGAFSDASRASFRPGAAGSRRDHGERVVSASADRPIKRRWEILIGRYTLNPVIRGMFKLGITPPGMALVETIGRRTGAVRHTPVICSSSGDTLWLIAQHGRHAGWVLNFEAKPAIRVRIGRRWLNGTAELLPDDDVGARIATFAASAVGRAVTAATFRALESQPVTVRIQLAR